jgi:hypothetical protein
MGVAAKSCWLVKPPFSSIVQLANESGSR